MKPKQFLISAFDVGELLPFGIHKKGTIEGDKEEVERAKKELDKFMELLEKNYGIKITSKSLEQTDSKQYEKFIFENQESLNLILECPVAITAQFADEENAKKFCEALKTTIKSILPEHFVSELFLKTIKVKSECDDATASEEWGENKEMSPK